MNIWGKEGLIELMPDRILRDLRTPEEAAEEMRVCKRQFRNLLKQAETIAGPIGIPVGKKRRVFDDNDMETLKEALRCSRNSSEAASGTCAGPSRASVYKKLREHRTRIGRRKSASSVRTKSSTAPSTAIAAVIPLPKRP